MTLIAVIAAAIFTMAPTHHTPVTPLDQSISTDIQYQDGIWADAHVFDGSRVGGCI